jgi:hypothetical protein
MAPTVSWRVGSEPDKAVVRDGVLAACQIAAEKPEFADFSKMEIW